MGRISKEQILEREKKDKKITLCMQPSLYDDLKADAIAEGMTTSGYINFVLRHRHDHDKKK